VDRTTALLSVLPAGLAEMAGLAQERGARADVVTVTHTIRVTLVVLAVPLALGVTGTVPPPTPEGGSAAALAACLAIAAALALLARRLGMLSPWIVVPLLIGAAFAAVGVRMAAMPGPLVVGAQVAIGAALGARLRVEGFRRLPRTVLGAVARTAALSAVLLGGAAPLVARSLGLDAVTATLALAPGGLGEMIAAARSLHVAVPAVVGFHFVRSLVTNLAAPWLVGRGETPAGS
jgi:membrane AbrB-like protein